MEALSDGTFAIAMTLLILHIRKDVLNKWRRRESNPHQGGSKTPSRSRCYRLTP
ncbi:TMEM175 family protein [Hyalangium minutum]|uniref:TMEM175 family protein n=1 Tax=Hyalangium minutum TaxID=394096 RepID=UPI003B83039D